MAAPTTSTELYDLIRKSELLPAPRLDAFVRQTPPSPPRELAIQLVAAGLVTQFQAEQFLQGRWKGFTIGKYKVLERLGAGGMGTVYLCEHATVGRKVAVKVLPSSQSENETAKARFYREARAAGILDHPNLVKAHDVDEENGTHFLVMDYVDGSSLQSLVARFGPLPHERAAHYMRQAALGLQAAHEAGLIHRDVKPANIMLERNGTIRVLDLGLARFFQDTGDPLTLKYDENNVLGTADYVAPEQAIDSHEVDTRADIYSLGATFYFLLTGQTPFPVGRISQKLIWLQVKEPTAIRDLRPEVPEGLARIVERMMAKSPANRYAEPADVADALAAWAPEVIPLPDDREMPRLSPAAQAASVSSDSRALPLQVRRPSGLIPQPAVGAVLSGQHRTSNSDLTNTPPAQSQAPTTAERPRPAGPIVPSKLLGGKSSGSKLAREVELHFAAENPGSRWTGYAIRAACIVLFSGAVGVGLALAARLL